MTRRTKQNAGDEAVEFDDLTAIKGIRDARQQWFREMMKVRTYHDLAALSVEQIETGLKAERQFPSRSMITGWIAQAKALAEIPNNQEQKSNLAIATEVPKWKPFASFVIEFQVFENPNGSHQNRTNAHHIETDKNQLWLGIESKETMNWMLAQSGIQAETITPSSQPEVESQTNAPDYSVQFSDKLQRVLAKTAKITGTSLPTQVPTVAPKATPKETPISPQFAGFSDKMQQILARTQKLTTKTT